jgi:hypothetical protein
MPRTTGTAQRERGMSDMISAKTVSISNTAKAAPSTWALDWTMTDSSDDDSIQRRRSVSEPHVYGDDSSSLEEEEAPFLPSPSDLVRGSSGSRPSPFLLPAPRRLRFPEDNVYQHNRNATHNNNHARGTRRRTFSTEDRYIHRTCVDTAVLFRPVGRKFKYSLRNLALQLLKRAIQLPDKPHCSEEDVQTPKRPWTWRHDVRWRVPPLACRIHAAAQQPVGQSGQGSDHSGPRTTRLVAKAHYESSECGPCLEFPRSTG